MDLSTDTEELQIPLISTRSDDEREGEAAERPYQEIPTQVTEQPWYRNLTQMTAMLSNFSTSYNVVNISLVLPILQVLHSASEEALASCASSLLAGMIVGQVAGGAMGDTFLGRLGALRLVMVLQIVTSLGSSLISVENGDFYMVLSIWRFVLGISAGAVYPLAAVLSAESVQEEANDESSNDSHHHDPVHSVVLTFSTQGLGFVTVPIVADTLPSCKKHRKSDCKNTITGITE